jgi:DNA-binding NtrC family response regulator
MMTESETIDVRDLPEYIRDKQPSAAQEEEIVATLEQVERSHAFRVLESVGGNKVRAAEILGVSRTKLYRILGDSDSPEASLTAPTDLSENSN